MMHSVLPGHWIRRNIRFHATKSVPSWGVVLDIDGVVVRGSKLIPGSAEAIRRLQDANVPYMFMTNGGGVTEEKKAQELSSLLGIPAIDASKILLSHTPMRSLIERYRHGRVVIVGAKETPMVAQHYGFDFKSGLAVTPCQIIAGTPGMWPGISTPRSHPGLHPINLNEPNAPKVQAAMLFYDPLDWGVELQVLIDALSGGDPVGSGNQQAIDLYASNPDFLWQAQYPVSRFGAGAFIECLRALWQRKTGGADLKVQEFGKPHKSQFDLAHSMLAEAAGVSLDRFQRLYMVGDNPAADIRGANGAGDLWRSVLVCTGVYRGGVRENDPLDPAWRVTLNLEATVDHLMSLSDKEHLSM